MQSSLDSQLRSGEAGRVPRVKEISRGSPHQKPPNTVIEDVALSNVSPYALAQSDVGQRNPFVDLRQGGGLFVGVGER